MQPSTRRLIRESRLLDPEARAELGVASISHGGTTTVFDLDELRGTANAGARSARAQYILNGPEGIYEGNPIVNIFVERNSTNAIAQRLTCRNGVWARTATNETSFNPWMHLLTDADLPDLSEDPAAYIPEGGTLYVVDPEWAGTDLEIGLSEFNEYAENGAWSHIYPVDGFEDGGSVSHPYQTRAYLYWKKPGIVADCDVTARARLVDSTNTVTQSVCGVIARATGTLGYWAGIASNGTNQYLRITRAEDGTSTVLAEIPLTIPEETEFYVRLRVVGNTLRAKAWLKSHSEPEEWMLSAADATYKTGYLGLGKLSGSRGRFNMLSAAWGASV